MVLSGTREGMIVGSEQSVEVPNGHIILNSLWSAMAFPMPMVGPARRPRGVLVANRLIHHYAPIAGELLAVDIACRLESRAEADSNPGSPSAAQRRTAASIPVPHACLPAPAPVELLAAAATSVSHDSSQSGSLPGGIDSATLYSITNAPPPAYQPPPSDSAGGETQAADLQYSTEEAGSTGAGSTSAASSTASSSASSTVAAAVAHAVTMTAKAAAATGTGAGAGSVNNGHNRNHGKKGGKKGEV